MIPQTTKMIPLHFFKILLIIIFLLRGIDPISCLNINYPSFQTGNNLNLGEDSAIGSSAIQVTLDNSNTSRMTNQSGRVTYKEPLKLWRKGGGGEGRIIASFSSTFVINTPPMSEIGGEGLAFLLTENSTLPENSEGQWLGIVNQETNGSSKIVAIEFDTFKSYAEDIDDNHVGLDVGSVFSIKQVSLTNYGVNLSSGLDVEVKITYDGKSKNLTGFVAMKNGTNEFRNPVFSQLIDLSEYLPETVYVGFSASTSNNIQLNCVRSWEFQSSDIDGDKDLTWLWITIPVVAVLLVFSGFLFFVYKKCNSKPIDPEGGYANIEDQIRSATAPRRFRFKELKKATDNFSQKNKLGKGGFGTVYKGIWGNKEIAVKRVSKRSNQGKQEFISEVTTIGNLNHRNLVKLIGWCYESRELVLVYECMPNGSLEKYIFSDNDSRDEDLTLLNWETRVCIINGVAQALEYLHYGCEKRVLHRDIKASNIMLDSEFNAKLGDFGLARIIQEKEKTHHSTIEIAGTPGYMAPETFLISRATVETDVYSFGVLILEVVCGRRPGRMNNELQNYNNSLVNWIWDLYKNGRIVEAADSGLEGKFDAEQMKAVMILGLACCHPNPNLRPCMKNVMQVLTGEADPPPVPLERPSFMWPAEMPPLFGKSKDSMTGSQIAEFTEITGR